MSQVYGLELLPAHMRPGVERYVMNGIMPGDFLRCVLENDLVRSFGRADSINSACMAQWASWLYVEAPQDCWGSPEVVEAWCNKGGLEGRE